MRRLFIFNIIIILAICFLAGCQTKQNNNSQATDMETTSESKAEQLVFSDEKTAMLFKDYQNLQQALFKSDTQAAQTAAGKLKKSAGSLSPEIEKIAGEMAVQTNLEEIRSSFSTISMQVETILTENLLDGTLYKQFCPMALDNQGAYWMAEVKEINNPYFGSRMAKCGRTVETISR